MEPQDIISTNKNEQSEGSGRFQSLQEEMVQVSTDSTHPNATPGNDVETPNVETSDVETSDVETSDVESDIGTRQEKTEQKILARAVTEVALEGFNLFPWDVYENNDVFNSFKDGVFDAMLYFVWNLYDKEDFENIAFFKNVYEDCKNLWELVCSDKQNIKLELFHQFDATIYENIWEQNLCSILRWDHLNSPSNGGHKDFSGFKNSVLFSDVPIYSDPKFEERVGKAERAMKDPDNLNLMGMDKKKLLMELAEGKCFNAVDALFILSWKKFTEFQKLVEVAEGHYLIEEFLANVVSTFYVVAALRRERLDKCLRLVTYPLSSNIYGTWDSEVEKVIKWADLKRRSEGRRFIGTDHLLFYLHQSLLLSESPYKSEEFKLLHNKPSVIFMATAMGRSESLLPSVTNKKHRDTIHHLYQRAYTIAKKLGDQVIRVEHLYVAISSDDDDEVSWKHAVECARLAKIYWEGQLEVGDQLDVSPWCAVVEGFNEGRLLNCFLADLQAIQAIKKGDSGLWDAVAKFFLKVEERTEAEMLSSLEMNIGRFPLPVHRYFPKYVAPVAIGMIFAVCWKFIRGQK